MKKLPLLALLALSPLVRADSSVKAPKAPSHDAAMRAFLYLIGTASQSDATSPIKFETTVWTTKEENQVGSYRQYSGSITLLRGALSYALIRGAGLDVDPTQSPESAFRVSQLMAFSDEKNDSRLDRAVIAWTGRKLVKSNDHGLKRYDKNSIESVFDKLYLKPESSIAGVKVSIVYQLLFKEFVTREANATAEILARKDFVETKSKEYVALASKAGFEGSEYQWKLAKELGGSLESEPRLIGTLLRRRADGTLPSLLKMLRTILRDYDPALSHKLDAKLQS